MAGDAFPFAAIARELRLRGHKVVLATSPLLSVGLRSLGIAASAVGVSNERQALHYFRLLSSGKYGGDLSWIAALRKYFQPWSISALDQLTSLASKADLVVTHPLIGAAYEAAQLSKRRCVTLHLFPCLFPAFANQLGTGALACSTREQLTLLCEEPLPNSQFRRSLCSYWKDSDTAFLVEPVIGHMLSIPGPHPGLPQWSTNSHGQLPPELVEFVVNGQEPLVLVTQGSISIRTRQALTSKIIEATKTLGYRSIILGVDQPADTKPDERVRCHRFIPIELLAPYVKAAVHHAGAGTIRTTIASQIPAVTIPGPFDTSWNSSVFAQLGLTHEHGELASDISRTGLMDSIQFCAFNDDQKSRLLTACSSYDSARSTEAACNFIVSRL